MDVRRRTILPSDRIVYLGSYHRQSPTRQNLIWRVMAEAQAAGAKTVVIG